MYNPEMRLRLLLSLLLATLGFVAAAAGCAGCPGPTTLPEAGPVVRVDAGGEVPIGDGGSTYTGPGELFLTPAESSIFVDDLAWFRAFVRPPLNEPPIDVTEVTAWSIVDLGPDGTGASGEPTVAVKGEGVWLGVTPGHVEVTAGWLDQIVTGTIVVRDPAAGVEQLLIDPPSAQGVVGFGQTFRAFALYDQGDLLDVTALASWTVDAPGVADLELGTIATEGSVRAVGVTSGDAVVSASFAEHQASADLEVLPFQLSGLSVLPVQLSVPRDGQAPLTALGEVLDTAVVDVTEQVEWLSDDLSVATVGTGTDGTAAGLVTGIGEGQAEVEASLQGLTATSQVSVAGPLPEQITIWPAFIEVPAGTSVALSAQAVLDDGTVLDVTEAGQWSLDNEVVAALETPTEPGPDRLRLVGIVPGEAEVTVTYAGVSASAPVEITAAQLEQLELIPADWRMPVGIEQQLWVFGTYSGGERVDLTAEALWSSSDPNIATVSNAPAGLAQGVSAGEVTVTAQVEGTEISTLLTITEAQVAALYVHPNSVSVAQGLNEELIALAIYTDDTQGVISEEVTWTSLDAAVADVANGPEVAGLVTGVTPGATTIMATYDAEHLAEPLTEIVDVTVTPGEVEEITIAPFTVLLTVGRSERARAFAQFSDGATREVTEEAAWTMNNASVATVANSPGLEGVVTGQADGMATVSASFGGVVGETPVYVLDIPIDTLALFPRDDFLLAPGVSQQLYLIGVYEDVVAIFENLTWEAYWWSANEDLAVVDNYPLGAGRMTALAPGQVAIRAEWNGMMAGEVYTVLDLNLVELTLSPPDLRIPTGSIHPLVALGTFDDGSVREVSFDASFESLNPEVLSILENDYGPAGNPTLALAVSPGAAQVRATMHGVETIATIEVIDATPSQVVLAPVNALVPQSSSIRFYATAIYDDGTLGDVSYLCSWASSEPSVLIALDDPIGKGTAFGLGQGEAVVTAVCPGGHTVTANATVF